MKKKSATKPVKAGKQPALDAVRALALAGIQKAHDKFHADEEKTYARALKGVQSAKSASALDAACVEYVMSEKFYQALDKFIAGAA